MNERPIDLLPELLLLAGAIGGLLTGLFLPRARQWIVALIAATAVLGALAASVWQWTGPTRRAFGDSYRVDHTTGAVRIIICVSLLLLLTISADHVHGHARETEFYTLMLLGGIGAITLAGANDLLLLMAAYLLASVPLYALVGFDKDAAGTEATIKYYLMGALLGMVMLTGITVLYGLAGQTGYPQILLAHSSRGAVALAVVALLAGLSFKAGAVPAHFWVPDVAEGASPTVAAYVTTIPKIGALAAFYRLFDGPLHDIPVPWRLLLAIIATATMTLGNLAAFTQTAPRRLLAYSTISQVGYLILPVVVATRPAFARNALLFYLAGYALTNIGAFAVAAELPGAKRLEDYRGLFQRRPALALSLIVCLLGLVGTPPTAVFVGKLAVFSVAIDGGWTWLTIAAVLNTVASVFYYLRWIAPLFASSPDTGSDGVAYASAGRWTAVGAYVAAAASVALGLGAGAVLATGSSFS